MVFASVVTGTALAAGGGESGSSSTVVQEDAATSGSGTDETTADASEGTASEDVDADAGVDAEESDGSEGAGSDDAELSDEDASENEDVQGGVSMLATGDAPYTFTYTYNSQGGGGSTIAEFNVYIVDESGNAIDSDSVECVDDACAVSYTQSGNNNNNEGYSLSTLAGNFSVTSSDGSKLYYLGARVGSENDTYANAITADSIRYNSSGGSNNGGWQYRTESSNDDRPGGSQTSWTSLGSSYRTIFLQFGDQSSVIENKSFDHIDVKAAAAYTNGDNSRSVAAIQNDQLTYTNSNGTPQTVNLDYDSSNSEWKHQDGGTFLGTTTITITFSLVGDTGPWYTSTLTADTTYPENTYYPASGNCAYKLYNFVNGANISERQWTSNYAGYGDIDISGMSVFLVSAIVCNGSTVSNGQLTGTLGLDLVLNVATLLGSAPNFDFEIDKTLKGTTDMAYKGSFSFTFQQATVNENGTWSLLEGADAVSQSLETSAGEWTSTSATEDDTGSVEQIVEGEQVTYATSSTEGSTSYYYILYEDAGTEEGVYYDSIIYGIHVVVTTTMTSGSGSSSTTTYETEVESVAVYELTSNEEGTYSQDGKVTISPNNDNEYVFPFTNSIEDEEGVNLTIVKKIYGLDREHVVGLIDGSYSDNDNDGLKFDVDYFGNQTGAENDDQTEGIIKGDWTFSVVDTFSNDQLTNFRNRTDIAEGEIRISDDEDENSHYVNASLTEKISDGGETYYEYRITISNVDPDDWYHVWEMHAGVDGYSLTSTVNADLYDADAGSADWDATECDQHEYPAIVFQLTDSTTVTFVNTYVRQVSSLPLTGGDTTALKLLLSGGVLGLLGVGVWLLARRRRTLV